MKNFFNKYFLNIIFNTVVRISVFIGLFLFSSKINTAQTLNSGLRINEFMAVNSSTLADKDGEYSDWIEIYNASSNSINLTGWVLTDSKNLPLKWAFPYYILASKSYLIVFASGKDIHDTGEELHTNFKLSSNSEYLALISPAGDLVSEFDPYPEQMPDISWAYNDGDYIASATPTPGKENEFSQSQLILAPVFNYQHGFYENPFQLEINSDYSNSQIYYTIDGSEPGENNGMLYNSPITIDKTTVLRAVVIKSGILKSKITTATYLFLDNVINQPNDPAGYPKQWGEYIEETGIAIADYEMDPEITHDPSYAPFMKDALLQIPTLSIVTNKDNLFSSLNDPDKGGIYIYTGPDPKPIGKGWERSASVELFNSEGTREFQIECEIEIHGGASRQPEKTPKHSFRLSFGSKYGSTKLNFPLFGDNAVKSFSNIVLRAVYGNTWLHRSSSERLHAQLIHDTWGKDTQFDMGNPSGHGIFVHLYINGIYWGIYNPTERIDDNFCKDYFGGAKEDYDVVKDYPEAAYGNLTAWKNLINIVTIGKGDNASYQRIQGKNPDGTINPLFPPYLDVVNFIDYMIINYYGANWDWDSHNWLAVRNRIQPDKGFKFFIWDAEHIVENPSSNVLNVNNVNMPTQIFQCLKVNPDFRRLFADRVQLHCFNGGVLTSKAGINRWMKRASEIDLAIIAESARWGDYRRDVHRSFESGPFELYTREHWLTEQTFLKNKYFPNRVNQFIAQLRQADLFPGVDAPLLLVNGKLAVNGIINSGDVLSMRSTEGTIYYTLDGSDPASGNEVSPYALTYEESIDLNKSIHIKSRTLNGGEWSALNEVTLILQTELSNLKLTEINYHPLPEDSLDGDNFEFLELKNTGSSSLDLSGTHFIEGVNFSFPINTSLKPGKFIVLASDTNYFKARYGFKPFSEYEGLLNNSGERIILVKTNGDTVISVKYNDRGLWPEKADGEGYSLVSTEVNPSGNQDNPSNWTSSFNLNGSPEEDDKISTNIKESVQFLPKNFILYQNYPNPFNSETIISYDISSSFSDGQTLIPVSLKIYDILGRQIAILLNKAQAPGTYYLKFDASKIPSGIYFYKLESGNFVQTKKMVLLQ